MGIKTEERIIRGIKFITTTLPVLDASVVWFRLGKVFAPAMTAMRAMTPADKVKLINLITTISSDAEQNMTIANIGDLIGVLGPAFSEIFSRIDIAEVPGLFRGLFGGTIAIRDGAKYEMGRSTDQINAAFNGDEGALWLAAFWVGAHNYSSFGSGRLGSADAQSTAANPST